MEEDYAEKIEAIGLKRGRAAPTIFHDHFRDMQRVAHGDDFTFLGYEAHLEFVRDKMLEWYEIKIRGILGPEASDMKEIVILCGIVKWHA